MLVLRLSKESYDLYSFSCHEPVTGGCKRATEDADDRPTLIQPHLCKTYYKYLRLYMKSVLRHLGQMRYISPHLVTLQFILTLIL